jgi:putative heme-binding domain-containing protein
VSDPWGLKEDWAQSSMARILELLADPRPAVRARAQRLLARRGATNLDQLRSWLLSSTNRLARLGGLWALAGIESPAAGEILRALLDDTDLEIGMATARVLAVRPERAVAPALQAMLARPEPPARLAAAQALAHCGNAQSLPFVWNALTNSPDPFLAHALVHAAHHLADAPALQAALGQPSSRVQEAALRLLAQPPRARLALTSAMLLPHLGATDASLQRTAWELLRQRPEWAAEAATALRREPRQNAIQESARAHLSPESWKELFLAFERSGEVQAVATGIFQTGSVFAITQLLEALPRSELAEPPAGWIDGIVAALVRSEPGLRWAATRASARWPEGGASRLVPALQSLTQETNQPPALRLEAARALLFHQPEPTPTLFAWLLDYVRPNGDPVLTLASGFALSRSQLSDGQLLRLFSAIGPSPLVPPMQFLRTFRRSDSVTDATALVEVVGRWLEMGWRPADREYAEFTQRLPETLRSRAVAMRTSSLSQPILARQRLKLDTLSALLQGGSPPAGRQVFFSSKAGCSVCHAIGAAGGRVGPDLTRLGLIRSGRDLLESIVFPSATFAQGYEPYTVTTKDGAEWNGFLAEQSAESVLLREPSGLERRMPREEIQELRRQSVSVMPEGLEQALTETEFRDLLAFLQSLR